MQSDEMVRETLFDFLEDWNFPRIRRVGRVMLLDIGGGDIKRGVETVQSKGWASAAECEAFKHSVDFGHQKELGAHSRFELRPGQSSNSMNMVEAAEFLRRLLANWIESKI